MDMLDSEITDPSISPQHKYAEMLREFGKLVEEMDVYSGELNLLKREIRKLEEIKHLETIEVLPDRDAIEKYDGTIGVLKEAYAQTEKALSICELRAAELRPVFYGLKPRYTE